MAKAIYILHRGSGFSAPKVDKWNPPTGQITWFEVETAAVSTSGPSLAVSMDLTMPRAKGREQVIVLRVRDAHDYLPSPHPDFTDPEGWLAVSVVVSIPVDGNAEDINIAIPYSALPEGLGGLLEVEVAVHDPAGLLTAVDFQGVAFPEDFDRSPDPLTVIAHTLITLVRETGDLSRDEVREIREVLSEEFALDDMGDTSLRRILKRAHRTEHSHETLSEVISQFVPADYHDQLVTVLYQIGRAKDGHIRRAAQVFIRRLLDTLSVHDHVRLGPERLLPSYATLELDPGADPKEIKRAYKALITAYHPDKVSHLAQGFIDFANDRVKAINSAYSALMDAQG
jgi:uncharacterized tellurite resistance protein B-like protein